MNAERKGIGAPQIFVYFHRASSPRALPQPQVNTQLKEAFSLAGFKLCTKQG